MAKLLGDDAYKAARSQTTEKLNPMRDAFIAIAKKSSTTVQGSQLESATEGSPKTGSGSAEREK